MDFTSLLFYVFSTILVLSALRVVTARNPVHAALWLVLAFFQAAGIWLLLKAEFLAITLVLVYVGAVMVLFLFVVMMLDLDLDKLRKGFWKNLPLAAVVGAVMVLELAAAIFTLFPGTKQADAPQMAAGTDNTKMLGKLIYTEYVWPFELAAVLLLVGIVAAIALTLRRRKDSRYNDPSAAVRVRAGDRLRMVQMPAVKRERAGTEAARTTEVPGAAK